MPERFEWEGTSKPTPFLQRPQAVAGWRPRRVSGQEGHPCALSLCLVPVPLGLAGGHSTPAQVQLQVKYGAFPMGGGM